MPSEQGPLRVVTVAEGLEHPWGLAFLPDGRMLVTERPGRLRFVTPDGALSTPLAGVPEVYARGQGGLLEEATLHQRDVARHLDEDRPRGDLLVRLARVPFTER